MILDLTLSIIFYADIILVTIFSLLIISMSGKRSAKEIRQFSLHEDETKKLAQVI